MSHTIDSLNRAGAATAAARIAGLEAEVARLRALVALGVEVARAWVSDMGGCDECGAGPDRAGRTACGRLVYVVRAHDADCALGRFLREAEGVGRV